MVVADEDGLSRLALALAGGEVCGCVEMMSGAVWVRDQLATIGWEIKIADARKVKAIAPLACKTDRVDARVLADLARRDLVPELWVPSVEERANREDPPTHALGPHAHLGAQPHLRATDPVGNPTQSESPTRTGRAGEARRLRRARGVAAIDRHAVGVD
jgi:hypothetical protein